jgi:hypothetical protein
MSIINTLGKNLAASARYHTIGAGGLGRFTPRNLARQAFGSTADLFFEHNRNHSVYGSSYSPRQQRGVTSRESQVNAKDIKGVTDAVSYSTTQILTSIEHLKAGINSGLANIDEENSRSSEKLKERLESIRNVLGTMGRQGVGSPLVSSGGQGGSAVRGGTAGGIAGLIGVGLVGGAVAEAFTHSAKAPTAPPPPVTKPDDAGDDKDPTQAKAQKQAESKQTKPIQKIKAREIEFKANKIIFASNKISGLDNLLGGGFRNVNYSPTDADLRRNGFGIGNGLSNSFSEAYDRGDENWSPGAGRPGSDSKGPYKSPQNQTPYGNLYGDTNGRPPDFGPGKGFFGKNYYGVTQGDLTRWNRDTGTSYNYAGEQNYTPSTGMLSSGADYFQNELKKGMPGELPAVKQPAGQPGSNIPWKKQTPGIPEEGATASGTLAKQREGYKNEVARDKNAEFNAMAMMVAEEGHDPKNSKGRMALYETMLNRAVANKRGGGISGALGNSSGPKSGIYYQPFYDGGFEKAKAWLTAHPEEQERIRKEMAEVHAGSNYSNYGTDNASGSVADNARRLQTPTAKYPLSDQFSRKDVHEEVHGPGVVKNERTWHEQTVAAEAAEKAGNPSQPNNTPTGTSSTVGPAFPFPDEKASEGDKDIKNGTPTEKSFVDPVTATSLGSGYGENRGSHIHQGDDIVTGKPGASVPVHAIMDGTIESDHLNGGSYQSNTAKEPTAAHATKIRWKDGSYSLYMHHSALMGGLKAGDKVSRGQQIAMSGIANGVAHLHFEHNVPNGHGGFTRVSPRAYFGWNKSNLPIGGQLAPNSPKGPPEAQVPVEQSIKQFDPNNPTGVPGMTAPPSPPPTEAMPATVAPTQNVPQPPAPPPEPPTPPEPPQSDAATNPGAAASKGGDSSGDGGKPPVPGTSYDDDLQPRKVVGAQKAPPKTGSDDDSNSGDY